MIDDEYLLVEGEAVQPPMKPTAMGLCVYSCGLFEILADILVAFYSPKPNTNLVEPEKQQVMLTQVLGFNSRLDRFFAGVPIHLKADGNGILPSQEASLSLQREVLHRRYAYRLRSTVLY